MLSHALWVRRFGRDPGIAGRTTLVDGRPFTIVGVMPPGFSYPDPRYQLWAPLPSPRTPELPPENRAAHYLRVVGRLRAGASVDDARLELRTIAARLGTAYPETNQDLTADVAPLAEHATRDARAPLYLLLGAVALVALIACGNVTNLLLARATARTREVAIRQALGASRWRLVRQGLVESLLLYALGAAGALAAAAWGLAGLVALDLPAIPRLDQAPGRRFRRRPASTTAAGTSWRFARCQDSLEMSPSLAR